MGLFTKEKTDETDNENKGGDSSVEGVITITEKPENGKRGRGRPKGSGAKSGTTPISDKLSGTDTKLLDELYQAKMWAEVAGIPFDIRRIMTGSTVFSLTPNQKDILGVSLAATLKQFGIIDPKYAALIVLLANMSKIWLEMEIRYRAGLPAKKDKKNQSIDSPEEKTESGGIYGGGFSV